MDGDTHGIGSAELSASVKADGAELTSLKAADGRELLWQARPEWPRHAPILFPIVGKLAGDTLRRGGTAYHVTQHGFARDRRFEWSAKTPLRAVLRLADSPETRERFPFAFELEQAYAIEGRRLTVSTTVSNPGGALLPCAVGAHPAFSWPLAAGVPKARHRLVFDSRESGPMRLIESGLLGAQAPLPFDGAVLPLDDALFAGDALVMPNVSSASVRFEALGEGGEVVRAITVAWSGYKDLGIWSKPSGADFLCIEPWYGMASPVGWDGDFGDKPGILHLAPGESRRFEWSVEV